MIQEKSSLSTDFIVKNFSEIFKSLSEADQEQIVNVIKTKNYQRLELTILKQGDYVIYNSKQEYNGLWRVLYDTKEWSDVEIVSDTIVEFVTLSDNNADKAKVSYADSIKILNEIANKYLNPKYAQRARCIGSDVENPNNHSVIPQNIIEFTQCIDIEKPIELVQFHYLEDTRALSSIDSLGINCSYWLAARNLECNWNEFKFQQKYVCENGNVYESNIYFESSSKKSGIATLRGLRPVITIKNTVRIISGEGTMYNPYVLCDN